MTFIARVHAKLGDLWWYTALLFVVQRLGDAVDVFTVRPARKP